MNIVAEIVENVYITYVDMLVVVEHYLNIC